MNESPLHDAWSAVRDCGSIAYIAILFAIVGVVVGPVAITAGIISKGRAGLYLGLVATALGALCFMAGGGGVVLGRSKTDQALAGVGVDPTMVERIRVEGYREAAQCVSVGGATGTLPLFFGVIAIVVTSIRQRKAHHDS